MINVDLDCRFLFPSASTRRQTEAREGVGHVTEGTCHVARARLHDYESFWCRCLNQCLRTTRASSQATRACQIAAFTLQQREKLWTVFLPRLINKVRNDVCASGQSTLRVEVPAATSTTGSFHFYPWIVSVVSDKYVTFAIQLGLA